MSFIYRLPACVIEDCPELVRFAKMNNLRLGYNIIEHALSQLGIQYVWYGPSPSPGRGGDWLLFQTEEQFMEFILKYG